MCGARKLNGALMGRFLVNTMDGIVSLDGAEGVTRVGVNSDGRSIYLSSNPILTSAIALTNTEYPAGTLFIQGNTKLECVPSAWPATDQNGVAIPHGSCPTTAPTPAPTPAPGGGGSSSIGMIVGIVIVALALVFFFFLFYRRQQSPGGSTPPVQKSTKDVEMGAVDEV
jgi:hypothetical protein